MTDVTQQFAFFQLAINYEHPATSVMCMFFFFTLIFNTYVIGFTMVHLTIPVLRMQYILRYILLFYLVHL